MLKIALILWDIHMTRLIKLLTKFRISHLWEKKKINGKENKKYFKSFFQFLIQTYIITKNY